MLDSAQGASDPPSRREPVPVPTAARRGGPRKVARAMDVHPRPLPPILTLSTRASRLLRLSTFAAVADHARLDGLDLDLSRRPVPTPVEVRSAANRAGIPVRSIWVPARGARPG